MIQKFATVPASRIARLTLVMILAGASTLFAQQPADQPPAQQPAAQQPADQPPAQQPQAQTQQTPAPQEATAADIGLGRKPKVKDWKNWSFNVGGGASFTSGTTTQYARGGGIIGGAGVARNYSKYFGFRLDVQYDNLPLRSSALQLAQAPGATSQVYSFMLDPIINIPVNKEWGGYVVGGPAFLHRTGKLDSSTMIPGSACGGFFTWWGVCNAGSLPLNGNFLKASQNEFGENFGAGITRKITPSIEFYAEWRLLHGSRSGITTDFRPITIGVRW